MRRVLMLSLAVLIVIGCNKTESKLPAAHPAVPKAAVTAASAALAVEPAREAKTDAQEKVAGRVAETQDVQNYTYLRVGTATGDVWAAIPKTSVAVGTDVAIRNPMPMQGFESKSLNRKFDVIYFGEGIETAGGAAAAPAAAAEAVSAPHPAPSVVEIADVKVEKATGPDAKTIAEIYAEKAALKDQSVAVRGKVVKFTAGILGRNWVHLRDGTGTLEAKDNDLTFTTESTAATGDVVIAKGVVHLDKDFGAGYSYPVIIEEATLTK